MASINLKGRDYIETQDFSPAQIDSLLAMADELKAKFHRGKWRIRGSQGADRVLVVGDSRLHEGIRGSMRFASDNVIRYDVPIRGVLVERFRSLERIDDGISTTPSDFHRAHASARDGSCG